MTWRDVVRPIIAAVLRKLGPRYSTKRKERVLFGHYPWPERRSRRYHVWRDEVRIQLGQRPDRPRTRSQPLDLPGQRRLF